MAFDVSGGLNEIRIRDQRDPSSSCTLFARDPNPREQLSYAQEALTQKGGRVVNNVRRTRLKWGCLLTERCQAAIDPDADGYGFFSEPAPSRVWVPLTPNVAEVPVNAMQVQTEYAALHGAEWAKWISTLPPWKVLLLARAPMHFEAVAGVLFEGVAEVGSGTGSTAEAEEGEGSAAPN